MKSYLFILLGLIVSGLFAGCEPEPNYADPKSLARPDPIPQNTASPSDDWNDTYAYEWKMVVKSVDSFVGGTYNAAFKDVLLGNTLTNGISTTNTTYFYMYPESSKVKIKLIHMGWTLWEAYGFYPIIWEFTYEKTPDFIKLEGFANMGLSICELPEGSNLINRFYFSGTADSNSRDKYLGTYVWSETYENGTCIWIEGDMEVLKE